MDQLSAKQNLIGTFITAARSAEEKGKYYTPLNKISRFNEKMRHHPNYQNLGQPVKYTENRDDHWTIAQRLEMMIKWPTSSGRLKLSDIF